MVVCASCAKKLIYLLSVLLRAEMREAVLATSGKAKTSNTLGMELCLKSPLRRMRTKMNAFPHSECHVPALLTKCSYSHASVAFRPILEASLCAEDYRYDPFPVHG